MPRIYLAIGSNLGDRKANCLRAIDLMCGRGIDVTIRSSLIETEPWGVTGQPRFINMAVAGETELKPLDLLETLKDIEAAIGRKPAARYGPRLIDLDILLYDDLVVKGPSLTVPHPHMHERAFVLGPLAEIAPGAVHPVMKKTVAELLAALSSS